MPNNPTPSDLSDSEVENDHADAGENAAPISLDDAYDSVLATLSDTWDAFWGHLPLIVAGCCVLIATGVVAFLARSVVRRLLAKSRMRNSLRSLLDRIVIITVWVLGLLLASMVVFPGLTPTKALGGLGLASVAIGFAFKDMFENFFAGVLLLWKFPFDPGDYIECEGVVGEVEDTTIRMTTIRTVTDELVVVPNSFLFKNPVRVVTYKTKRRISVMTGVAYDVDLKRAVDVVNDAVLACNSVDRSHQPQILPCGFGSSSMDIEVTWWCDATPLGERKSRAEVILAIKQALDREGLEIPFPYRTLTFKEPLPILDDKRHKASRESDIGEGRDGTGRD